MDLQRAERSRTRFAWIVASPVVLGAGLLIFIVVAWGAFDVVASSGTTSTAIIVAGLLILVPGVIAAWQKDSAVEHAQRVFEQAESVLNPPARPSPSALPTEVGRDHERTGLSP